MCSITAYNAERSQHGKGSIQYKGSWPGLTIEMHDQLNIILGKDKPAEVAILLSSMPLACLALYVFMLPCLLACKQGDHREKSSWELLMYQLQ